MNYTYLPMILFVLPLLNSCFVVKFFGPKWLKVIIGVIVLIASWTVNFSVLYVFNMTIIYMKSPIGEVSVFREILCHSLVFISCSGITFHLYRVRRTKQRKQEVNLT